MIRNWFLATNYVTVCPDGSYLHGTTARHMFRVFFGSDFWLRLVFEIEFHRLDLLVAAARLVSRVVQGADFGLGVPLELHLGDLRLKLNEDQLRR